MANWIDRARREILEKAGLGTAVTAKRNLTAVLAVTHLEESGISRVSNGSNGSTLEGSFLEIELGKMATVAFYPVQQMSKAIPHREESEISKSVSFGTAVTDERNPTSVKMAPFSGNMTYGSNRLPYPERRALYARQNGLYLRLKRRLDKFERLTSDPEIAKALESWAGDHAVLELYAGERPWAEHRRIIYTWAKAELASIRSQRKQNIGGKQHAE